MKISITKRIDLEAIVKNADWTGTYLLVKSCGSEDMREFNRGQSQISNSQKALKREIAKYEALLQKQPEDTQLIELLDQLSSEESESSVDMFDLLTKFIQDRFMSGTAYDSETKSLQPLTREDVTQFSIEILKEVAQSMMGVEKKS